MYNWKTNTRVPASITFALVLALTAGCQRRPGGFAESQPLGGTGKVTRVEELLIGKYPGVEVTRTDGGDYLVSIRGTGSFMSGEQPLYVIDDVPYEVQRGRGLAWLNPADVIKIDVLKNPTEIGIYGVRGANGVIVITTKRP